MRLFEKMTKILRDNDLAESYAKYVDDDYKSLQIKINKLKEVMTNLSQTRRKDQVKERKELVEHLFRILEYIDNSLCTYEYDFIDLSHLLKLRPDMQLTNKINNKVLNAINSKTQLRKEFEIIYRNFKNMAKKFDDIPMKEILKLMREVFDFNSTKLNEEIEYVENKYYDANTGKTRILK